ncbi:MAG TPA: hypothetical protein DDX07_10035, partial [Porphyromonadaceae bacterium]|nr:hypothetical protein [Porphyromonadaceae bacterium]
ALILTAPVALFGFLNGLFPILLNKKLQGFFKDKQFIPSVRYAAGLFFVPIFDLIQSLSVGFISHNWLLAFLYSLVMPATFYFALYWRKWRKAALRDRKVQQFVRQQPETWKQVLKLIQL